MSRARPPTSSSERASKEFSEAMAPPSVAPGRSGARTKDMENVWEYPRPPAVVPCERRVRIELGGALIADSTRALRVLETSHPPTIYVPLDDVAPGALRPAAGASVCEWKGRAAYFDVVGGERVEARAAWLYPQPVAAYAALRRHVAVYP